MKNGIMWNPWFAAEVPAAIQEQSEPASLMPSWRICPSRASL